MTEPFTPEQIDARAAYRTAHRLMMLNSVLWFIAGAVRINGDSSIYILFAGFAFAITGMFYYYAKLRRLSASRPL